MLYLLTPYFHQQMKIKNKYDSDAIDLSPIVCQNLLLYRENSHKVLLREYSLIFLDRSICFLYYLDKWIQLYCKGKSKMSIQALPRSHTIRASVATRNSFAFADPEAFIFPPPGQQEKYAVHCSINPGNSKRQDAYQHLRAQAFVNQSGCQLPVGSSGRVRDRCEQVHGTVSSHCIYGLNAVSTEYLLAGVRVYSASRLARFNGDERNSRPWNGSRTHSGASSP